MASLAASRIPARCPHCHPPAPPAVGHLAWRSPMQCIAPLIVIIDRDAATLAMCDDALRSAGYATIGYQKAMKAQRCLPTDWPSLLLLDLDLEWYDAGWDLLRLLRRERATAALPVIIWSADRGRLRARQHHQQPGLC